MINSYFIAELSIDVTISPVRLGLLGASDYALFSIESQVLSMALDTLLY